MEALEVDAIVHFGEDRSVPWLFDRRGGSGELIRWLTRRCLTQDGVGEPCVDGKNHVGYKALVFREPRPISKLLGVLNNDYPWLRWFLYKKDSSGSPDLILKFELL